MMGAHAASRILDKQIEETKRKEGVTLDYALNLFKDTDSVKRFVDSGKIFDVKHNFTGLSSMMELFTKLMRRLSFPKLSNIFLLISARIRR